VDTLIVDGRSDRDATDDRQARARELGAIRRHLFLVGTAIGLVAPWILWASGISARIWSAFGGLPDWLGIFLYVACILIVLALIGAPLGYYRGHVISHRFGLSTQGRRGWLVDWLKGTVLGTVLATAAGGIFYLLLWTVPGLWWIVFGLIGTVAMLVLTFLAPYVLLPLFFKPRPLEDPALENRIEDLSKRAGAVVAGISRLDFSRRTLEANAAVIGFGHSRRVILADTLLESFTADEIEAVVAHELGHHVNRDVARMLTIQVLVMFLGLALAAAYGATLLSVIFGADLTSPSSFPLVLFGMEVFGLLLMPAVNAYSRARERAADVFGFGLLGGGAPFASAMRRLADQNLAELRPPRWAEILLYTHPPLADRIAMAEEIHHG